jgi:hypothetical protein
VCKIIAAQSPWMSEHAFLPPLSHSGDDGLHTLVQKKIEATSTIMPEISIALS